MRAYRLIPIVAIFTFVTLIGIGCGSTECEFTATCVTTSGAMDAGDSGIELPNDCDLGKHPKDSSACIDDRVAIFASPNGDDASAGTAKTPVRTISRAVELAANSNKPRIYICAGSYTESVELKRPVSIFGGFICEGGNWRHTGAGISWNATKSDYAIRIVNVPDTITIADVEMTAAKASTLSDSSVGIFVVSSKNVRLDNLIVIAGTGADGRTSQKKAAATNAAQGGDANNPNGGAGATNTCPDGNSTGGKGGTIGVDDATEGQPALGGGRAGKVGQDCQGTGGGGTGANGSKGTDAPSTTTLGALTSDRWQPADGLAGKAGTRAQGGGGGGARTGGGAGGGAGGCGGEGGLGGTGGGGSFAIVSYESGVSVIRCKLLSAQAGRGGDGAGGQPGQPPGGGGTGGSGAPFKGCDGAQGGVGGNGGAGAGGAGGISTPIFYKGPEPTVSDSTLQEGTPGLKGKGGDQVGNDGIDGDAKPKISAP